MLPSGVVSVDGQTLDATSEGMVIEAGQTVRIIKIEANRLVVRAVEGEIPSRQGRESAGAAHRQHRHRPLRRTVGLSVSTCVTNGIHAVVWNRVSRAERE